MGAISNGLATFKGIIPFTATFLVFSDYMRPPIRLAASNRNYKLFMSLLMIVLDWAKMDLRISL